jgi:hypothetical protein
MPTTTRTRHNTCAQCVLCSSRCGDACCSQVAATRWLIQDELRIQTTQCDNCIIGTSEARGGCLCVCLGRAGVQA